jgi:hypothetical protein
MAKYFPNWDLSNMNSIPPEIDLDQETGQLTVHPSQPPMARTSEDWCKTIINLLVSQFSHKSDYIHTITKD